MQTRLCVHLKTFGEIQIMASVEDMAADMVTHHMISVHFAHTSTLKCIGAPTDAAGISLDRDILVDALVEAQQMRPERYTVLNEAGMSHEKALKLAKETNVL